MTDKPTQSYVTTHEDLKTIYTMAGYSAFGLNAYIVSLGSFFLRPATEPWLNDHVRLLRTASRIAYGSLAVFLLCVIVIAAVKHSPTWLDIATVLAGIATVAGIFYARIALWVGAEAFLAGRSPHDKSGPPQSLPQPPEIPNRPQNYP